MMTCYQNIYICDVSSVLMINITGLVFFSNLCPVLDFLHFIIWSSESQFYRRPSISSTPWLSTVTAP